MQSLRNTAFAFAAVLTALAPVYAQDSTKGATHIAPKLSVAEIKQAASAGRGAVTNITPCACLKEYVDWAKQNSGDTWHYVTYTVAVVANNGFHNYAEGYLFWNATQGVFEHGAGNGDQEYVNTMRDAAGHPWLGGTAGVARLKLDLNAARCAATVHLGNSGPITVPLQCNGGTLYGFSSPGMGWMITLKKMSMPIVR